MTVKNQDKNISAEDITQLFDIKVEQNNGEITAVKLTRKNFYDDEVGQTYDLMDYFYTEQEIDNFVRIHLVVYDSYAQLPQVNKVSSGQSNYIYLVPFIDNGEVKEGVYKEYVWVKIKNSANYRTGQADHNDYILNGDHYNYEALGSTEIDLTQIRQDIETLKQTKLDKSSVTNILESNNSNPVMSKTVYNAISEALDTLNEDSLFLSANTNVIQKDDTITLVAKQYGQQNNNPISFYKGDTLLETVPSKNGMASYSYVGTGAGKTEFTAKSGIIQSEIYEVMDCIVADVNNMLPTSKYVWSNPNVSPSVEIEDDHKKLSAICTGQTICRFSLNEYLTDNFEITYKIESNGTNGRIFGLLDANNISNYAIYNSNFPYIRIFRQGDVITFEGSADGISWNNITFTESSKYDSSSNQKLYLGFGWGANGECWIKVYDVKIYYI